MMNKIPQIQKKDQMMKSKILSLQRFKVKTGVVFLLGLFMLCVLQSALMPSITSAESEPKVSKSYLQIFSEKGTYTKVRITLVGSGLDNSHSCGSILKSTNGYYYEKKLSKSGTTRISCDPVSGNLQYRVAFYKGSRIQVGQEVITYPSVNVDAGNCTVIHPHSPAPAVSQLVNKCPSAANLDTVQKHSMSMQICLGTDPAVCPAAYTNVNPRKGALATISLTDSPAYDGSSNVSKVFCTGFVEYKYRNTGTGADSAVYKATLHFKAGGSTRPDVCVAKVKASSPKLASGANYTIVASYKDASQKRRNIYLGDISDTAQTTGNFKTK